MTRTALKIADAQHPLYLAGGGRGMSLAKLDNPMTTEEALKQAGLDWHVKQTPVLTPDGAPIPGYVANVREDTNTPIAVVKDTWELVQNDTAFAYIDEMLAHGEAKIVAANSRRGGMEVNVIVQLEQKFVLGKDEEILPLLTLHNGFNGWISLSGDATPFRLACLNGMLVAMKGIASSWRTGHTKNVEDRLAAALTALSFGTTYYQGLTSVGQDLLKAKLTKDQFAKFLEQLIPLPDMTLADPTKGGRAAQNVLDKRAAIQAIRDTSEDLENVRATKWGALQSVTQYLRDLETKDSKRFTADEAKFGRQFGNQPLAQAAFDLLTAEK